MTQPRANPVGSSLLLCGLLTILFALAPTLHAGAHKAKPRSRANKGPSARPQPGSSVRYYGPPRKRPPKKPAVQVYSQTRPKVPYRILSFQHRAAFNRHKVTLAGQSKRWRTRIQALGKRLEAAKLHTIYFVHGTFVGHDPIGFLHLLRALNPGIPLGWLQSTQKAFKNNNDFFTQDRGNYTKDYVRLFEDAIGGHTHCRRFTWSSQNHHLGRVRGSIRLVERIAQALKKRPPTSKTPRFLLLGHSHAGQLFALLTHYLTDSPWAAGIQRIALPDKAQRKRWQQKLKRLKAAHFDIVTFGTPPRYTWCKSPKIRLLHIINHRGKTHLGGKPGGFWHTKKGDYIQQWGIAGTDLIPSTRKHREANKALIPYLGASADLVRWKRWAALRMRVHQQGRTLLVDYKDASRFFPNFLLTLFGHGVYTRLGAMLFNTELLVNAFYPTQATDSDW